MATITGRALHYVFKIGNRSQSAKFYRDILGMQILRHEEFSEGCEASCNGPYENRWSKTMVGYGPEDSHFVIELTYNYPIPSYKLGNDFIGITIHSREALERAKLLGWPIKSDNILEAPGGYNFFVVDHQQPTDSDPVEKVTLACSNLEKTIQYWNGILGLKIFSQNNKSVVLGFDANQVKVEFREIGEAIDRGESYGRIAFSCPFDEQPGIEESIKKANQTILTPLISLETPGKATVRVIILADPDGHEICFVDDEGFRQLSVVDSNGDMLLNRYIQKDPRRSIN